MGLFTHTSAKIGGFHKDMNYDTANVQRFTSKFYELFPNKAFRPVDFAISNIGNTDFNPEEEEQRYTSAFDFVPGAVQNMDRSLELMRKYVRKTIESFRVGVILIRIKKINLEINNSNINLDHPQDIFFN